MQKPWMVFNSKKIVVIALSAGLSACGGGGSSSSAKNDFAVGSVNNSNENISEPPSRQNYEVTRPAYSGVEITESNAPELVESSLDTLQHLFEDQSEPLTDLNVIELSDLSSVTVPHVEIDLSEIGCAEGGSASLFLNNATVLEDAEGNWVYPAGSGFRVVFNACRLDGLKNDYQFQGQTTYEVLSGLAGFNDGIASANGSASIAYDSFGMASQSGRDYFKHGSLNLQIEDSTVLRIQGQSFGTYVNSIPDYHYQLSDFSLAIEKLNDYPSYKSMHSLSTDNPFGFGFGDRFALFNVAITSPLIFDDWYDRPQSGAYTLKNQETSLKVIIYDTHVIYRLDLDADSIYEIEEILEI